MHYSAPNSLYSLDYPMSQVNRVHLKQLLDKDQKELELLQEAFADVDPIQNRKRKFRWNNVGERIF